MDKIKKINYGLLLIVFCFLIFSSAQSQSPVAEITLTWSTDSYLPLAYPGKALPVRGSIIEVAANIYPLALGEEINPQELVYNWFINDYIQKFDSGLGRQVFRFDTGQNINQRYLIKAEIKNRQGLLLALPASVFIELHQPEIVIQSTEPQGKTSFLNPFQSAPAKYQISPNQEIEFIAQPYFFNIKNVNELNYLWSLNDQKASQISPTEPNIFVLKIGQLAQAINQNLIVWAENKNNPLQRAQTNLKISLIPNL